MHKLFKIDEFRSLIGFNHTWLIIGSILITGSSFPFIFLGNPYNVDAEPGILHSAVGWLFSAVLHVTNLAVFYRFKQEDAGSLEFISLKRFFSRNYPVHLAVTSVVTIAAFYTAFNAIGMENSLKTLARCITGCLILMSVIVGFYEAAYYMTAFGKSEKEKEQLKRQNAESQLEVLKSQVQPHFLFNSLNTLASIIPEEPEKSVKYVQNLSNVYRYILEIKDKKLIPVYEEMKCVHAYLFMLETRFSGNLRCNVDLENISENHFIVPLSIQMLIENAVKHNVISSKRPLHITISADNKELKVSNNFQLKEQDVESTGTGLKNIKNRYAIIANREVRVVKDATVFSVSIPLIEVAH